MGFIQEWLWMFVVAAGVASFVAAISHKMFNLRGYDASYRGFNAPGFFSYAALILWCLMALAFCRHIVVLGWFNVFIRLAVGCVLTILVCYFFYGIVHFVMLPFHKQSKEKVVRDEN